MTADTVKTFTAPYSGVVNLKTVVARYNEYTSGSSNTPTTLRILLNDLQVYPTARGENGLSLTSTAEKTINTKINVIKGDKIRIVIGADGNVNGDAISMTNTVKYTHVGQMNLVALTDYGNSRLVVYDISTGGLDLPGAEIWSWNGKNCDEVKLVYSSYYKGHVVITTAAGGYCAVIDYSSGSVIWETTPSYSPHSVELLPNGNIVVACSGGTNYDTNGRFRIYKSSQGSTEYVDTMFSSAHGLVWDNKLNVLWVLGYDKLCSYKIGGTAANPTVSLVSTTSLPTNGGHDLSPDYSDDNVLLLTTTSGVYKFNKTTKKIAETFDGSAVINREIVKGFSNMPGECTNVFVRTIAANVIESYLTNIVEIVITSEYQGVPVVYGKCYKAPTGAYYKVRTWYPFKR